MSLKVEDVNDPDSFDRISTNLNSKIASLGDIDYAKHRRDLQNLHCHLETVFDPTALAKDMARVQGYKDRAVEIVRVLTENYLYHKSVVEILTKGWTRYSTEKSAEKREGEALLKMSEFIMAETDAEVAYRFAMGVLKNLESQMDSVSRQIACTQAAAKISFPGTAYESPRNETMEETEEDSDGITDWEKLES